MSFRVLRGVIAIAFGLLAYTFISGAPFPSEILWVPNVDEIGAALFKIYGVPFEVASLIIVVAVFAAIYLVRRDVA
jgi:NADH:ubiquinone oxidoreductase subunit 6 (subunit J)